MYNNNFSISLLIASCALIGCERSSLSPVEIKIDDDSGYARVNATVSSNTLMSIHVVSKGETLFDVAYKYNIDPINLANFNKIPSPYEVKDGQVLRLPTTDDVTKQAQGALNYGNEVDKPQDSINPKLDQSFAEMMEMQPQNNAADTTNNKGTDFNSQAAALSVAPATHTATGKPITAAQPKKSAPSTSSTVAAKQSGMLRPVNGKIISKFGDLQDGIANDGINIQSTLGTNVKAAANGQVIYAGNKLEEEFGNVVIVQHDNDLITSYAHLDKIIKKTGAKVRAGDVLGTVGKTGDVSSPQLHFEVMKNKKPVDPMKYLGQ